MSYALLATAGASLVGASMSSNAAKSASNQQAQSGRESNALQKAQYDQTRADNAGVRNRGDAAGNRLSYLMGTSTNGQGGMTGGPTTDTAYASLDRQHMARFGTPAPRGPIQDQQAQDELKTMTAQYQASNPNAMTPQNDPAYGSLSRDFNRSDMSADPQYAQLQPYINSAMKSANMAPATLTPTAPPPTRSGTFEESPGYQFRMSEGLKATGNNQNAANGSYSGATLKALARFGQDTASQEYGNWLQQSNANRAFDQSKYENDRSFNQTNYNNDRSFNQNSQNLDRNFVAGQGQDAFNRYTGNQDRQYNRLAGIAGTGQTATNSVNSAGAAYAQGAGNTLQGIGNAQAAGTVGSANAYTGALQNGVNNYQQNQMMQAYQTRTNASLYPSPSGSGSSNSNDSGVYYANRIGQ